MINDNDKMKMEIKIWTDNRIGIEGARMISESLKTNSTLTTLGLNGDLKNEVNVIKHQTIKKKWKC